jgi:hypothetical protein
MWLLLTYLLTTLGGIVIVYFLGLAIEQAWPAASLPAFLLMFFGMLYVTWIISVKITAPKSEAPASN